MKSQAPRPSCLCMASGPLESNGEGSSAPLPKQAIRYMMVTTSVRAHVEGARV